MKIGMRKVPARPKRLPLFEFAAREKAEKTAAGQGKAARAKRVRRPIIRKWSVPKVVELHEQALKTARYGYRQVIDLQNPKLIEKVHKVDGGLLQWYRREFGTYIGKLDKMNLAKLGAKNMGKIGRDIEKIIKALEKRMGEVGIPHLK